MQRTFGSRGLVVFDTGHLYQYFCMRLLSVFSHLCKLLLAAFIEVYDTGRSYQYYRHLSAQILSIYIYNDM